MEGKSVNPSGFFTQVFVIFGASVLMILGMGVCMGEDIKGISSLFSLGNKGISYEALLQLLIAAFCISAIEKILFKETFFGGLSYRFRTAILLFCIILLLIAFIIRFGWFPTGLWQGWTAFLLSFGGCFTVSMAVTILKSKKENRLYEERLKEYKEKNSIRKE